MKKWLIKLLKDGIRKRILIWIIPLLLKNHHLGKDSKGNGRKKKVANETP